jgi:hypothetical protein
MRDPPDPGPGDLATVGSIGSACTARFRSRDRQISVPVPVR